MHAVITDSYPPERLSVCLFVGVRVCVYVCVVISGQNSECSACMIYDITVQVHADTSKRSVFTEKAATGF